MGTAAKMAASGVVAGLSAPDGSKWRPGRAASAVAVSERRPARTATSGVLLRGSVGAGRASRCRGRDSACCDRREGRDGWRRLAP